MAYDVVIVGAGVAGLSTAIRLKQRMPDLSVCVLEKGAEVGTHILSGCIIDPRAISELLPDWKTRDCPMQLEATSDDMLFMSPTRARRLPDFWVPPTFKNEGCYIVRLGHVTQWLGTQAEALGVEIFAGFAATQIVYNEDGAVIGVGTGDMGVQKDGTPGPMYTPGIDILAKYTVFAEGSRGQLGRELIERFRLDEGKDQQTYALGIKEVWEIPAEQHRAGHVVHTTGYPLDNNATGGGFLYHLNDQQVAVGLVVGLDYENPYLSPYEEFQRFKTHPRIRSVLQGGKRIAYGARTITAGGILSLPTPYFPGGIMVGCEAGFLNAARIKGSHAGIKSGMLAADCIADAVQAGREHDSLTEWDAAFKASWLHAELRQARNFKQWMKRGQMGVVMTGVEQWLLRGHFPWTLHRKIPDHARLKPAHQCTPIEYPKPDNEVSFDRLSSVYLSNTHHDEDQPVHLTLKDETAPVRINWTVYKGPEQRFCPAGVYEYVEEEGNTADSRNPKKMRLQINAQNCLHCKTCDIKDPAQNIVWVAPNGAEGPVYNGM